MFLFPSLDPLQDAQISVSAANFKMRELKGTHFWLIVLTDVVEHQTLAQIEQLCFAKIFFIRKNGLGRKERSKCRGSEGDL